MNYLLAIIAGAIQGLSEFLPISSTGHLVLFEHLFKIPQNSFGLSFDASLHLGTLLAILVYFFKDYLKALKSQKMIINLIIGTIPAVIFGLLFEKAIETNVRQLWVIGIALIAFSLVMIYAEKIGKRIHEIKNISLRDSLLIGLFQSLALIPGVSRSGSTISAGLFLNLKRQDAARFAFMLSGPVIAGAGSKKFLEVALSGSTTSSEMSFFIAGMVSSAIVGYLTIKYFMRYLGKRSLNVFIYYRIILGLILLSTLLWPW